MSLDLDREVKITKPTKRQINKKERSDQETTGAKRLKQTTTKKKK
ncbi:hypothetical protein [uncultured Kordia sp.]|nr:hypothetical protein [uncultured Kordia sp.]